MIVRDPFGRERLYYAPLERMHATSLRELTRRGVSRRLDPVAVRGHFARQIPTDRTMLASVRAVPPGHALDDFVVRPRPRAPRAGDLARLLRDEIAASLRDAPKPIAVALSGGLDSAIVLALVHEIDPSVPAVVLDCLLPGYGEREAALATARAIGATVDVVEVDAEAFVAAVPEAIAALEVPLYNLHPVSKWLLASAAARAGIATLLGGDGADHVMTRDTSADYLPLVGAAFDAAGVGLRTPFLADAVVDHLTSLPIDREKRAIRAVAETLRVPSSLANGPKTSRLAPPLDLEGLVDRSRVDALARALEMERPALANDTERVQWTTLVLFQDAFEAVP